jgi:diadenosine tetraphosphate (Ap4A) HIT family hydrolase
MPLTPDEFFDNALTTADADGRVGLSGITRWDIFPFEQDGLRVAPLRAAVLAEPERNGEDPATCRNCRAGDDLVVWQDDTWRLQVLPEPSGAPLVLVLMPKEHFDVADLPAELAAQLGLIVIQTVRAIESLEHIARAHVSRWGDGGAHLHILFFARPEGFVQLRGTCLAIWDDLLAPVPREMRDADATRVGEILGASLGGSSRAL